MITKRIIPCLDVKDGRVVKGVNFAGLQDVSSPVELAEYYTRSGADELVFYDITASAEGRGLFPDILRRTASRVFIPLTVGGGINTLEDFDRVLKCGADKVSVNSGAIRNPDLIRQAALRYGSQCVVLSADVKRVDGQFRVFGRGGRDDTGMEAIGWIKHCVDLGAGEVVVNSIDTDGVKGGFDLEMLAAVCQAVKVPVIASGGAGLGSTLDDYAAFATMLLAEGRYPGGQLFQPETVRFLTSPQLGPQPLADVWNSLDGFSYGKLMRVMRDPGRYPGLSRMDEYGWDGWLGTYFANFPHEQMTMLMMSSWTIIGVPRMTVT